MCTKGLIEAVNKVGVDVRDIEILSDKYMKRMRIHLENGYQMSIVQGEYSYGGTQGLYEIALYNKDGKMDGSLFDEEDQGDDVLGWCDHEKIMHYLLKLQGK